jgi:hypothetical protein
VIPLQAAPVGAGARHRRRAGLLVSLAVLVAAAGAIAFTASRTGPGTPTTAGGRAATGGATGGAPAVPAASPATAAAAMPSLGVYAGPGAATAAAALDWDLRGRVHYAMDYLADTSWTALADPSWLAQAWAGSPFAMVIGVPMLPAHGATLAEGAAGAYDAEFTLLAQRLVADGLGSATLLVGAQPDDVGTPWYVPSVAAARQYVAYWDRIEAAMSAVPGSSFTFEWDPGDSGTSPVPPSAMYPGNAAVGLVGTDAFDEVPAGMAPYEQWAQVLDRTYGPTWAATFAAGHGKPLSVTMWGVVPTADGGGGDSAAYVTGVLTWASHVGVSQCVLWDYGSWAIGGGGFPTAYAALVQAAGSAPTSENAGSAP